MHLVYLAAFLSWLQFMMRVISFYIIAQTAYQLYLGHLPNLVNLSL